jgi:archaea-specific DNA-binding protein
VSTWTRNIAWIQDNKKGVKKMAEETTPKPETEKAEETKAAENQEKASVETAAEEPKKTTEKPEEKKPEVVFIGNKPPMSYVMAVITAMSSGNINEIMLKARGRAITTAVDVAEITTNRFLKDLKVTAIGIGTEEMPPREGDNRARMVSTMEIKLSKQ